MFPTEKNRLGSTFGGGDLLGSMMGAFTLQAIDEYDLLANATRRGRQAKEILRDDTPDTVVDVRGKGLMLAVEFDTPERRSAVVEASLDRGLLTLGCGTKTIRLLPRSTRPNAKSRSARAFSSTRSTPSVRARGGHLTRVVRSVLLGPDRRLVLDLRDGMSLFEVPNRSDEHVHAVPDAPLVHVERRRVVTRRVVGTDDEVRRQPALS